MIPRFGQIPAVRRFVETTREAFHPTRPPQPFGAIGYAAKVDVTTQCDRQRWIDPRWLGHVAFFGLVKDLAWRIAGAQVSEDLSARDLPAPAIDTTVYDAFFLNHPDQAERLELALMELPRPIAAIGERAIPYASNPDLHPRKVAFVPGKIPFGDIFHLLIYGYRHLGLMSEFVCVHGEEWEHPSFLALHDLMYHMQHLVQVPQGDIEDVADFLSDCISVCPELAYEMPLWPLLESTADAYAGQIAPERSPLYQLHFTVSPFIQSAMMVMKKWGIAKTDDARLATHLLLLELGLYESAKTWQPPADWLG